MIDNFVLLVTCGACAYVVFRAVILDRSLPWFGPADTTAQDTATHAPPPRGDRLGWRARATAAGRRGGAG